MNRQDAFLIHLEVKELEKDGCGLREIVAALNAKWRLSYSQVVYYRDRYHVPQDKVVKDYQVPLLTKRGVVWAKMKKDDRRTCELCEMCKRCLEAVSRGDFIACEAPLEKELL